MRTPTRWLIALLLAVTQACAGGNRGPSDPPRSPTGALDRRDFGGRRAEVHGELRIDTSNATVVMRDNYFKPNVLTAPPRVAVTLMLRNEGTRLHSLSIPPLQIAQDVPPSSIVAVPIVAPAAGEVVFVCRFHGDDGMVGALVAR